MITVNMESPRAPWPELADSDDRTSRFSLMTLPWARLGRVQAWMNDYRTVASVSPTSSITPFGDLLVLVTSSSSREETEPQRDEDPKGRLRSGAAQETPYCNLDPLHGLAGHE
jgi:hypothetical protein